MRDLFPSSVSKSWQERDAEHLVQRKIEFQHELRVFFSNGTFTPTNDLLIRVLAAPVDSPRKLALLVLDEGLASAQPGLQHAIIRYFAGFKQIVTLVCPPFLIQGGERSKNSYFYVSEIHSLIDRYAMDRYSYVIAVGGGALLDFTGLAAANALRGTRLVRIPTTTLSQCECVTSLKNGINAFGKKDFVGSFYPPFASFNDFHFLGSLSPRDKRAGFAEAVKVALIRDGVFFDEIEQNASQLKVFNAATVQRLIRRSVELHMNHIATAGDPFEFRPSRPLDYGHWAAHKLERLSEYRISHGEAVAIGVALDSIYSNLMGFLPHDSLSRILSLLATLGFDLAPQELVNITANGTYVVFSGLEDFRASMGGQLNITVLKSIGGAFEVNDVDNEVMAQAIKELANHGSR